MRHRLGAAFLVAALSMAALPARADETDLAALALAVQAAVAAACGNCLIGVRIGEADDRQSWSLDFTPGATAMQQQSAFVALQAFDLDKYRAAEALPPETPSHSGTSP